MTAESSTSVPKSKSNDDTTEAEMPPLSRQAKLSLMALSIASFFDMAGYMAVFPSLIFYVRELGGSNSQYGLILAANNFTAFLCIPIYAHWVDTSGNKYRKPIFLGISLQILGMLLYTFAVAFGNTSTNLSIHVLLVSRIVYGTGAACGSTCFSYIASVVTPEQLTFCTTILAIAQSTGLMLGPFFNTLVGRLDVTWHLFGWTIPLNSYNGVGFLLVCFDVITIILVYFFLTEPPSKKSDDKHAGISKAIAIQESERSPEQVHGGWSTVFREALHFKLLVPLFTAFVMNANYQLLEGAFPPAASHGLGWGPVQISAIMGVTSIMSMSATMLVMTLSMSYKVADTTFIATGNIFSAVSGLLMFLLWNYHGEVWHFVAPITIGCIGYSLMGPANTSHFSKAVMARPDLEPIQARLMGVSSMVAEIANFSAPLFVGSFVLRSTALVESGGNKHELTPYALYVPILSGLCIIGAMYEMLVLHVDDEEDEEEVGTDAVVSESSTLLKTKPKNHRSSLATVTFMVSDEYKAKRLRSSSIMGSNHSIPVLMPFDTPSQRKSDEKLLQAKKEWDEFIRQAFEAEGAERNSFILTK